MKGIFRKKKAINQQVIICAPKTIGQIMAEWKITAPEYITDYNISYYEDYMYIKVYYTQMSIPQKNDLYLEIAALDTDWSFLGVREYYENHEMCFVFRKGGYKLNI